jgi:adenosylhomocysteine nucleosidase
MHTHPSLGIVAACEAEAALIHRRLSPSHQIVSPVGTLWQGRACGQDIALLRCGMGVTRALPAVTWLVQHVDVWGVISVGFAGALQPHLATGDAVLVTQVRVARPDHEPTPIRPLEVIEPDSALTHLSAVAANHAALTCHTGVLLSSSDLISQAVDKQHLGQRSGALAVDMESYSIGRVAAAQHLPFTVLRTIFDTSHENLAVHAATWMTSDGVLQPRRVLDYCVRHPYALLHLPRLWYKTHIAGKRLEHWLHHFLTLLSQYTHDSH